MHRERSRLEGQWYTVQGKRMYARVGDASGGAATVVFVPGLGMSGRYLVSAGQRLATRFHVLIPDLPGFGQSERPERTLDIPGLADALLGWMDAAGLERATLIGHSMGCQVAVDVAARYAERVDRLVLSAPTMDRHARSLILQFVRLLLDVPRERLALVPVVLCDHLRAGPVRMVQTFRHALQHRIEEQLPDIAAPVLVLQGQDDPVVPVAWAEEVARSVPRGRLHVLSGTAHAAHFSEPERFVQAIEAFLLESPLRRTAGRSLSTGTLTAS